MGIWLISSININAKPQKHFCDWGLFTFAKSSSLTVMYFYLHLFQYTYIHICISIILHRYIHIYLCIEATIWELLKERNRFFFCSILLTISILCFIIFLDFFFFVAFLVFAIIYYNFQWVRVNCCYSQCGITKQGCTLCMCMRTCEKVWDTSMYII